jgi:hypothetical protein
MTDSRKQNPDWFNFQEEICEHFINLGANASTNVKVDGVRGPSNIDVLVESKHLGTDFKWLVEAKHWKSKVTKEIVHAFSNVVQNTGSDRGFIISKVGFQSGAFEAATMSNISLYTFEELKKNTNHLFLTNILKQYLNRTIILSTRYWSHDKSVRIKYKLRFEIWDFEEIFSCGVLLGMIAEIITRDEITYPFTMLDFKESPINTINSFNDLINWLNFNLNNLDNKILQAEILMFKNNDFRPEYSYLTPDVMLIAKQKKFDSIFDSSIIPEKELKLLMNAREELIRWKEFEKQYDKKNPL